MKVRVIKTPTEQFKDGGKWIQNAVNPAHKGYCTPMSKSTCTPRRKALARTFKKHHGFHQDGGMSTPMDPQLLEAYSTINSQLENGADPDSIIGEFVSQGMSYDDAQHLLNQIQFPKAQMGGAAQPGMNAGMFAGQSQQPFVIKKPLMKEGGQTFVTSQQGYTAKSHNYFGTSNAPARDSYVDNDQVTTSVKPVPEEDATIEAEKGEYILSNKGLYKILGKKHTEGGTPLAAKGGEFIFSAHTDMCIDVKLQEEAKLKEPPSKKCKDNTPAKILERNIDAKEYNRLKSILENPKSDPITKKTAQFMLDKMDSKLQTISSLQEAKKQPAQVEVQDQYLEQANIQGDVNQQKQYAYGGNTLPMYQNAGTTAPDNYTKLTPEQRKRVDVQVQMAAVEYPELKNPVYEKQLKDMYSHDILTNTGFFNSIGDFSHPQDPRVEIMMGRYSHPWRREGIENEGVWDAVKNIALTTSDWLESPQKEATKILTGQYDKPGNVAEFYDPNVNKGAKFFANILDPLLLKGLTEAIAKKAIKTSIMKAYPAATESLAKQVAARKIQQLAYNKLANVAANKVGYVVGVPVGATKAIIGNPKKIIEVAKKVGKGVQKGAEYIADVAATEVTVPLANNILKEVANPNREALMNYLNQQNSPSQSNDATKVVLPPNAALLNDPYVRDSPSVNGPSVPPDSVAPTFVKPNNNAVPPTVPKQVVTKVNSDGTFTKYETVNDTIYKLTYDKNNKLIKKEPQYYKDGGLIQYGGGTTYAGVETTPNSDLNKEQAKKWYGVAKSQGYTGETVEGLDYTKQDPRIKALQQWTAEKYPTQVATYMRSKPASNAVKAILKGRDHTDPNQVSDKELLSVFPDSYLSYRGFIPSAPEPKKFEPIEEVHPTRYGTTPEPTIKPWTPPTKSVTPTGNTGIRDPYNEIRGMQGTQFLGNLFSNQRFYDQAAKINQPLTEFQKISRQPVENQGAAARYSQNQLASKSGDRTASQVAAAGQQNDVYNNLYKVEQYNTQGENENYNTNLLRNSATVNEFNKTLRQVANSNNKVNNDWHITNKYDINQYSAAGQKDMLNKYYADVDFQTSMLPYIDENYQMPIDRRTKGLNPNWNGWKTNAVNQASQGNTLTNIMKEIDDSKIPIEKKFELKLKVLTGK